jgi:hypothetical protein
LEGRDWLVGTLTSSGAKGLSIFPKSPQGSTQTCGKNFFERTNERIAGSRKKLTAQKIERGGGCPRPPENPPPFQAFHSIPRCLSIPPLPTPVPAASVRSRASATTLPPSSSLLMLAAATTVTRLLCSCA